MGYATVEGIDIDKSQIESCLKKELNACRVESSVDYLKDNQEIYDLVLALDVIEHVPHNEQLEFVTAIQKSLGKSGKLICTVPNASAGLGGRWRYGDWTHHSSFTECSLDFLLFHAGFDQIKIGGTEFINPPRMKTLLNLKLLLQWFLLLLVRSFRRLETIAELGWNHGWSVPLSLNLLATAVKLR
jgi:Methyltransferase domain